MIVRQPLTTTDFEQYYDLRWRILRQPWNQPKGSEKDELENNAFHILAEIEHQVVGVGRLHSVDQTTAQIRYMAVSLEKQRMGIGSKILQALEEFAYKQGYKKIILDARDNAKDFYMYLGYESIAEGHTLFNSIKHTQMQKKLNR